MRLTYRHWEKGEQSLAVKPVRGLEGHYYSETTGKIYFVGALTSDVLVAGRMVDGCPVFQGKLMIGTGGHVAQGPREMLPDDLFAGAYPPKMEDGDLAYRYLNSERELLYVRLYLPTYGPGNDLFKLVTVFQDDKRRAGVSNLKVSGNVFRRKQSEPKGCHTVAWLVYDPKTDQYWFEKSEGERRQW